MRRQHHRQATPLLRTVVENPHACTEQRTVAYWLLGTAYALDERWQESAAALDVASRTRKMDANDWYRLAYAQERAHDLAASQRLPLRECLKSGTGAPCRAVAETRARSGLSRMGPLATAGTAGAAWPPGRDARFRRTAFSGRLSRPMAIYWSVNARD